MRLLHPKRTKEAPPPPGPAGVDLTLSDRLLREQPGGAEAADALWRKAASVGGKGILFGVEALDVENVDTGSCEGLIKGLATERGRAAQGSVAFMFRDYDDRAEFLFTVPEVRRFVRALHEKIPHLFYFLSLEPMFAQFTEFAAAYSPDDKFVRVGTSMSIEYSDEVLEALFERLVAVWRFAELMGDDAERIVKGVAEQSGLPDELLPGFVAEIASVAAQQR